MRTRHMLGYRCVTVLNCREDVYANITMLRCEMKSFATARSGVVLGDDALSVAALCSSRDFNQLE